MPLHSALTGSDLHEPKGVAAANAHEVYQATGAGSGSWLPILEQITVNSSPTGASMEFNNTTYNLSRYVAIWYCFDITVNTATGNDLLMQLSADNGSSYNTSSYYGWNSGSGQNDLVTTGFCVGAGQSASTRKVGIGWLVGFNDSNARTMFHGTSGGSAGVFHQLGGMETTNAARNCLKFIAPTGTTFSSGVIQLYGIRG